MSKFSMQLSAFIIQALIILNISACADDKSLSYNEQRKLFKTQLIKNEYEPDGEAPSPPENMLKKITYPSADGDLVAYLSPDPADQKKHPLLIWARGGHGGIGEWLWDKDYVLNNAINNGLLVMAPSWRQDNANPGRFSLFLGEVDDALAAIEYAKGLDYIDPERIYMAGHSTGGTMALLTPLASKDIRASFSFGGVPDMTLRTEDGQYGREPYDYKKKDESYIRSATNYVKDIHSPIFYFEGAEIESYLEMANEMERKAGKLQRPFHVYPVQGSDHHRHLEVLMDLVTQKIAADTGSQVAISFTQEEVQEKYNIFAEKALSGYIAQCDKKDADACFSIAEKYDEGEGVALDYTKAIPYYLKACDLESGSACRMLGWYYSKGRGTDIDLKKAKVFYEKGCLLNDGYACSNLGYLYLHPEDDFDTAEVAAAVEYLTKACGKIEIGMACRIIGFAYNNGNGVEKNQKKAVAFYQAGCELEDGTSCSNLGYAYSSGEGVSKDMEKSKRYYKTGCDLGDDDACSKY